MKRILLCAAALSALLAAPAFAQDKPADLSAPKFGTWGVDLSARDTSVKPGDDFYRYAEGSALDKLVEIISLRGQPVIQGTVTGTGPYTLKFSTEHKGSWNVTGNATTDNSAADLKAAIIAHGVDYGFNANTTVTVSGSL